jgi:hypothetical protein
VSPRPSQFRLTVEGAEQLTETFARIAERSQYSMEQLANAFRMAAASGTSIRDAMDNIRQAAEDGTLTAIPQEWLEDEMVVCRITGLEEGDRLYVASGDQEREYFNAVIEAGAMDFVDVPVALDGGEILVRRRRSSPPALLPYSLRLTPRREMSPIPIPRIEDDGYVTTQTAIPTDQMQGLPGEFEGFPTGIEDVPDGPESIPRILDCDVCSSQQLLDPDGTIRVWCECPRPSEEWTLRQVRCPSCNGAFAAVCTGPDDDIPLCRHCIASDCKRSDIRVVRFRRKDD